MASIKIKRFFMVVASLLLFFISSSQLVGCASIQISNQKTTYQNHKAPEKKREMRKIVNQNNLDEAEGRVPFPLPSVPTTEPKDGK